MRFRALLVFTLVLSYALLGSAVQCGKDAGGALCAGGLCCSHWGWCGTTDIYCLKENGCQSNCADDDTGGGGGLADIITRELFEEMLPYRNVPVCQAANFYTYDAFLAAAKFYPDFATTGDDATRKREVAAFLGQTSHITTGGLGWDPPGGPYAWGYCFNKEVNPTSDYCVSGTILHHCVPGQAYYGRGAVQLTWNVNYGQCGDAIGQNLLQNPDLLLSNATVSFESALWFWMTPRPPMPSCHEVMVGKWTPSANDVRAGRLPGYGMTTNIFIGCLECGRGWNAPAEDRIGFYKRYCDMLGVSYGDNVDCYNQTAYNHCFDKGRPNEGLLRNSM